MYHINKCNVQIVNYINVLFHDFLFECKVLYFEVCRKIFAQKHTYYSQFFLLCKHANSVLKIYAAVAFITLRRQVVSSIHF